MRHSPELLAAVAAAAVPGVAPVATGASPDDSADFRSCVVLDAAGKRWRVRSPLTPEASMRLETEHLVLQAFSPSVRAQLPFHLPTVVGSVERGGLRVFVYSHLPGATLSLRRMQQINEDPGPPHRVQAPSSRPQQRLAVQIGQALAALHALPRAMVMDADLPAYSAEQCRRRMLLDLDRAAATGRVPGSLLRRWRQALDDTTLWRFSTRTVHGDLHEDNITVDHGVLGSVTGWSDLHVGDPAEDVAWLVGMSGSDFVHDVLDAYAAAAIQEPDPHLLRRAHLRAEVALAEWLVRGMDRGIDSMVRDAGAMLDTLSRDVERSGSPAPGVVPQPPAPTRDAEPGAEAGPEPGAGHDEASTTGPDRADPAEFSRTGSSPAGGSDPGDIAPLSPGSSTG